MLEIALSLLPPCAMPPLNCEAAGVAQALSGQARKSSDLCLTSTGATLLQSMVLRCRRSNT